MEKYLKIIQIILISVIHVYLIIFISINLFKTEFNDPPYNYLSRNWLNSPIKEIEILDNPEKTNIKEYDNQKNLGFFKSDSTKQDLNVFMGKFFKIKKYEPYYYPNFVGYSKKKRNNKICGKDSQGNILYFPKDEECPINLIMITKDDTYCNSLKIDCKYALLNDSYYLVTSNQNISGEIITQLRINYNNEICADSSVDLTFNNLLDNSNKYECKNDCGYDNIYHKIGEENVETFLNNNNIKNMKIKNNDNIFLSYRGYLAVDNIDDFSEHPIDHVTYARKIAFSKNIILFITWFYYLFCSIFIFYFNDDLKFLCAIQIIFIIDIFFFIFNFAYDIHVIFTFLRVKGIVSTVNLEGLKKYKTGLRWFIILDIFILFGIVFDFVLKLIQFLQYRKNFKKKDYKENKEIQLNISPEKDAI